MERTLWIPENDSNHREEYLDFIQEQPSEEFESDLLVDMSEDLIAKLSIPEDIAGNVRDNISKTRLFVTTSDFFVLLAFRANGIKGRDHVQQLLNEGNRDAQEIYESAINLGGMTYNIDGPISVVRYFPDEFHRLNSFSHELLHAASMKEGNNSGLGEGFQFFNLNEGVTELLTMHAKFKGYEDVFTSGRTDYAFDYSGTEQAVKNILSLLSIFRKLDGSNPRDELVRHYFDPSLGGKSYMESFAADIPPAFAGTPQIMEKFGYLING